MNDILKELNDSQRSAVEFCDGPSLIIAGAGSGKTRVLTYKIAYLLDQGLPPYHIMALTFTNKAAREMKSRISELVGKKKARQLWMGTFHSIFSRILRNEAEKIGFTSNFTIFDSSDSANLIRLIIKEKQLDDKIYKANTVLNQISRAKNGLVTPRMYASNKELMEYDSLSRRPHIAEIYKTYQNRLKAGNSMDFDDLLMNTNILFRDNPDVLEGYRSRFQYLLVDEYQDTNFSQHLIVKQLSEIHNRVCVVGDDAQSIYSFRGANIDNILKFKSSFPDTRIFKLEQNYRSTQNIVNAANSLIKKNKEQIFKDVFSENEVGDKLEVIGAFSDFEEALIVSNKIHRLRNESHVSYTDIAILYRTNAQSRGFEEALRKKNIPYRIYGGLSFYQRKEIKDVIGYFRLIVNPGDEEAFRRVINYPTRGIGNVTVGKISECALLHNVSLWQVLSSPIDYGLKVNAGTTKRLTAFLQLMTDFVNNDETMDAYEMAQDILTKTGIMKEAYQDLSPEGMSRAQNIQELVNAIQEFVSLRQEEGNESIGLIDFLAESSLLTDQDMNTESSEERVTLMTVHSAKGLEFEHVYVVGVEEDLFPSSMSLNDIRGLEEERRLFYVAITRAKKTCTLLYSRSRFRNGTTNATRPSRFLNDIDTQFLETGSAKSFDTRGESSDGFWGSMKQSQPMRNTMKSESNTMSSKQGYSRGKSQVVGNNFSSDTNMSDEALRVKEGDVIEHERFGRGVVSEIEQSGANKRAFVNFESAGQKQLLLKYAKFRILD